MSMKTSFVSEINLTLKQSDTKPQSFKQERKSRENSKQGHMNPLKMKASFLRQSLTLNSSEQNLTLNPNNTTNLNRNITATQPLVLQSDRREDFMMRKIVERFSNNVSPKNMMYPEQGINLHELQREREIIRLSGRKNQSMGVSHVHRHLPHEKENNGQVGGGYSHMSHSGMYPKTQHPHQQQPTLQPGQKQSRLSQNTIISQSTVFDNSLAQYTSNFQTDQITIVKQQLNVILKRLAKNQCDIEALKRDKSIEVQMEGVWKQFSLCENRFEGAEKKCGKLEEKLGKCLQDVQEAKGEVGKIGEMKIEWGNSIKVIQNKLSSELSQINQKLSNLTTSNEQSQKINDLSKSIKNQLESTLQRLCTQLEARIQTKLNQLKWQMKSDKVKESEENILLNKVFSKSSGKFTSSTKKAHQCISIVYKQLLKTSTHQPPSDRTKLLAGVFNQAPKRTHLSSPVTPQQQVTSSSAQYFTSTKTQPCLNTSQIEINQGNFFVKCLVQYFVDGEGYLLDESLFYIVDEMGGQIKLDNGMLEVLRRNGMIK